MAYGGQASRVATIIPNEVPWWQQPQYAPAPPAPPQDNTAELLRQISEQRRQSELAILQQMAQQQSASEQQLIAIQREVAARRAQEAQEAAQRQQVALQQEQQQNQMRAAAQAQSIFADPSKFVQGLFLSGTDPNMVRDMISSIDPSQVVRRGQIPGLPPGIPQPGQPFTFPSGGHQYTSQDIINSGLFAQGPPPSQQFRGNQLPVRETLALQQQHSPLLQMLGSIAQYRGQTPSEYFGDFESALPRGGPVGLSRFV